MKYGLRVRGVIAVAGIAASLGALDQAAAAQCGRASWYALHSRTASGERMQPDTLTAAHRSLPFGTLIAVDNLKNGRSVTVRINDRGPFVRGRVIDLSRGAARALGMLGAGTAQVRLRAVNDVKAVVGGCR